MYWVNTNLNEFGDVVTALFSKDSLKGSRRLLVEGRYFFNTFWHNDGSIFTHFHGTGEITVCGVVRAFTLFLSLWVSDNFKL